MLTAKPRIPDTEFDTEYPVLDFRSSIQSARYPVYPLTLIEYSNPMMLSFPGRETEISSTTCSVPPLSIVTVSTADTLNNNVVGTRWSHSKVGAYSLNCTGKENMCLLLTHSACLCLVVLSSFLGIRLFTFVRSTSVSQPDIPLIQVFRIQN